MSIASSSSGWTQARVSTAGRICTECGLLRDTGFRLCQRNDFEFSFPPEETREKRWLTSWVVFVIHRELDVFSQINIISLSLKVHYRMKWL